jgi:hypothetical protein
MAEATYTPDPEKPEAVRLRPPVYDQHARERYNLPADWKVYSWAAKGDKATGYVELKGGVFRKQIERGKRKGKIDYRQPETGTAATISLSNVDHEVWLRRWEAETGYCVECFGTGQEWAGWDHIKGNAYRPCAKCGATGRSAPTNDQEAA